MIWQCAQPRRARQEDQTPPRRWPILRENLRLRLEARLGGRRYARVPLIGKEPKLPALTEPDRASPLAVTSNSRVIGNGVVTLADQVARSPSAFPSTGSEPCWPVCVPVTLPPSAFSESVPFCRPIGELISMFQFPSRDMGALLKGCVRSPSCVRRAHQARDWGLGIGG